MYKNFISINDFNGGDIFSNIVPLCEERVNFVKERKITYEGIDKKVIFAFFESSTRTLGTYFEASQLLGYRYDKLIGEEATALAKKESIANTARMYAIQNGDIIVMRIKTEGAQRFIAEILEEEGYNISVQNGGDGTNQHPTQTFLDLLTIKRHLGRLDNFKIGFFGDLKYGRTVHSLLCALSHQKDVSVILSSDPETNLQNQYKKMFKNVVEGDSLEVLGDCDIIYGSRIQEERFLGDKLALKRALGRFRITKEVLNGWKKNVIIMHPLPYTVEITPEVRRDKRIIIDNQAWCGLPTRVFLLDEGYKNRAKRNGEKNQKGNLQKVISTPLEEYLRSRPSEKNNQYFFPIRNGIVIDHIPHGLGLKIRSSVSNCIQDRCVRHLIEDVDSKRSENIKDVVVIENGFLSHEHMIAICSISPTITINEIKSGVFTKFKLESPAVVSGIGRCPNENCITNKDPEAIYKFSSIPDGVKCIYCEKHFTPEEVLS